MLSSKLGHFFDRPFKELSLKIKIHPNVLSITGFLITLISAFLIPLSPFYSGMLLFVGGFFDMLDGIVARNRNLVSRFGAFLDSTLDRLSDALLFTGVAVLFYLRDEVNHSLLSLLCLIFSFLVSYTRARIEGLGGECRIGLAERPERILILIGGLLTGYIKLSLWIILIASFITTIQRIHHARRILR
ncbi:MAG: CDP-alcohol phosphatidyltransferase family protein [Thermodesulfovibrionales bacterium]|nr:CDP-alcohol phosphatidyltransferase family protein [Thermodesulfovibrionales bacterium]